MKRYFALFFILILFFSFVSSELVNYDGTNYVKIDLNEGWNLISGINFDEGNFYYKSNITPYGIWSAYYFDPITQERIEIRPIYNLGEIDSNTYYSKAFWVFSGVSGEIIYKASTPFYNKSILGGSYPLYQGNNLIAINNEMYGKTINEIKGDCEIYNLSYWNYKTQSWNNFGENDLINFDTKAKLVGHGLNIGVDKDCSFLKEIIIEKPSNFSISIATLYDEFYTGEVIRITDPPEEDNLDLLSNEDSKDIDETEVGFIDENLLKNLKSDEFENKYDSEGNFVYPDKDSSSNLGYIVQFEDSSVLSKYVEYEKIAKVNEEYIENSFILNPVAIYRRFFSLRQEDVGSETKKYSENLKNDNEELKNDLLDFAIEKRSLITGNAINDINLDSNIEIVDEFDKTFNGVVLKIDSETAEELKNFDGVKNVYPNFEVLASIDKSVDSVGAPIVWNLDINGDNCSETGLECLDGSGINVAIVDTGVDYTHPDLGGCFGPGCKVVGGYDIYNNDSDPMDDAHSTHGTHVAGIISANGTLKGVAPGSNIYAYKVLSQSGSGEWKDIIRAIDMIVDPNNDGNFSDHLDIASLSLGASNYYLCFNDDLSRNIKDATELGVTFVIAAGNDGPGSRTITYPGCINDVITVGSTEVSGIMSSFSSRGFGIENGKPIIKPDIVAPGSSICSTVGDTFSSSNTCGPGDGYGTLSGTSMATPHVSGAVALLKQRDKSLNPNQIKSALMTNTKQYGSYDQSSLSYGSGILSAYDSIISVSNEKLFLTPSISFGVVDTSQTEWTRNETIKISNLENKSITLNVSNHFIINPNQDAELIFPTLITVPPLSDYYLDIKIVAKDQLSYRDFYGYMIFESNFNSYEVPYFFKKMRIDVTPSKINANSKISIDVSAEIPFYITESYIVDPLRQENTIDVEYFDSQNYKSSFDPKTQGRYNIVIEGEDYFGNKISGSKIFFFDSEPPIINPEINGSQVILTINEDVRRSIISDIPFETDPNEFGITSSSIHYSDSDKKVYQNYAIDPAGWYANNKIYTTIFDLLLGRYVTGEPILLAEGSELLNYLTYKNGRSVGNAVYVSDEPMILEDSNNDIYTIYPYESNNIFCGVNAIGMSKLDKKSKVWQDISFDIVSLNVCTDDAQMCSSPKDYRDFWCEDNKTYDKKLMSNIQASIDPYDNIHVFWIQTNGGKDYDTSVRYDYSLMYSVFNTNGETLVPETEIYFFDKSSKNYTSYYSYHSNYNVVLDSKGNVYVFITDSGDNFYGTSNYLENEIYLKVFNKSIDRWSEKLLINSGDLRINEVDIDSEDQISFLISREPTGNSLLYYGKYNKETKEISLLDSLKEDYYGNKEGVIKSSENGETFILHQAKHPSGSGLKLDYHIFDSNDNSHLRNDFISDYDYPSVSSYSADTDSVGNFFALSLFDVEPSRWLIYGLLFRRITNEPIAKLTKEDGQVFIEKLDEENYPKWTVSFDVPILENDVLEVYATDPFGNLGYYTSKEPTYERIERLFPQSKIVNYADDTLDGVLNFIVYKNESIKMNPIFVTSLRINISANSLLKLDIGEDNLGNKVFDGFNNLNYTINESGNYKIEVNFDDLKGLNKTASWDFEVI